MGCIKLKWTGLSMRSSVLLFLASVLFFLEAGTLQAADIQTRVSESQSQVEISGTVTDYDGEPLVGATVIARGSENAAITDLDGHFTISASLDDVLEISFVGFETGQVAVSEIEDKNALHVKLKDDFSVLDESVVVGYGTQKMINLSGAVAAVSSDVLEDRAVTSITQALQGQVGNLNISSDMGGAPGQSQSINIRGYSGFGTTTEPLVVIDGIQGGNLDNINMSDVESISVLKDAASAAIYGSNAPFGAIIITTKKGKAGKPKITYENNFGFASPINLPRTMNSVQLAEFFNDASENSNQAPAVGSEQMQRILDYYDGLISYETKVNPVAGSDSWLPGNANNDWFDIFFKDVAFNHRHNIGVSGASDRVSYYIGLGYLNQSGIFEVGEDRYQRYNARVNLSTDITKWLKFNVRGSFARGVTDTIDEDPNNTWQGKRMHAVVRALAWDPFIYPNGTYNDRYWSFLNAGKVQNVSNNVVMTGEFVINPLPGWEIVGNYTFDGDFTSHSYHQKTVYQTSPAGVVKPIYGTPNKFTRSSGQTYHRTVNAYTSYEKQIKGHYFKAMLGYTQELYQSLAHGATNNFLYTDNLPSLVLTYGPTPSIDESASELAIRGGFGRINYNYKERYFIEFNGRYDATSRFLKDVRYKFYPGISGAWVPSNEKFWEPVEPYMNLLKVRLSYGQLGNQNIGGYYPFYPSLGTTTANNSHYLFSTGKDVYVTSPGLVDPSLTWETTTSLDAGIDMSFLDSRLNFSFDWYRRDVTDIAAPSDIKPGILGADPPTSNSAAIRTQGFELSLEWKDRVGPFFYSIKGILSDYRSHVLEYPNENKIRWQWYAGKEIGEIWGYESVGLFQSEEEILTAPDQSLLYSRWVPGDCRYADLDGDGKITYGTNTADDSGDMRVIGNTTPRYQFGFNLYMEYKGFDFTAFIQGVGKRDTYADPDTNLSTYFWGNTGDINQSNGFVEQLDRWSEDNPDGFYPNYYWGPEMTKNKIVQTRYLQNAAYVRLKNVQLGYTFPAKWMRKARIDKLRVYVSGENLLTFTKLMKTMDPEVANSSGYSNNGPDGKIYPLQRIWSFGVNITF